MFLEGNSRVDYEKILRNNKDLEIFEIFKRRLETIGIDSIVVTSTSRDSSYMIVSSVKDNKFAKYYERENKYYKSIPLITIYIRTIDNFKELNINEHVSKPVDVTISESVKAIWGKILSESGYEYDKYFDIDMDIYFRNFPKVYFINNIYGLREKIKMKLSKLEIVHPKEVYCSTMPALNIIYASMDDYNEAKNKNEFELINNIINKLFLEKLHKDYKMILGEFDYIKFLHPEMKGFNWYGYARQD